jgi:CRISPR-associated protein Cmr3
MHKTLNLEALDTLFFRDARPFDRGEESWAEGIFPPYPSVLYGMLRSLYFASNLEKLSAANTSLDPSLNLSITGLALSLLIKKEDSSIEKQTVFPMPADLYSVDEKGRKAFPLELAPTDAEVFSNFSYSHFLRLPMTGDQLSGKVQSLGGRALLDEYSFEQYLKGQAGPYDFHLLSDYMSLEPKIGIGRDVDTRTASEGMLYRVAMRRLQGKEGQIDLLLQYQEAMELKLPREGLARVGAEIKAVKFKEVSPFPNFGGSFDATKLENGAKLKLYLASPAIFEGGMMPDVFSQHGLKSLTAAIGRYESIGGFDLIKQKPKAMRRAVPAGSVYYLEVVDEKKLGHFGSIHGQSIYQLYQDAESQRLQREGFGLCYLINI